MSLFRKQLRPLSGRLHCKSINTTSDENSNTTPSTRRQFDLAEILAEEMKKLGVKDVRVDETLGDSGKVLSVKTFPHLKELKGRTLITTDGTTLLREDEIL